MHFAHQRRVRLCNASNGLMVEIATGFIGVQVTPSAAIPKIQPGGDLNDASFAEGW